MDYIIGKHDGLYQIKHIATERLFVQTSCEITMKRLVADLILFIDEEIPTGVGKWRIAGNMHTIICKNVDRMSDPANITIEEANYWVVELLKLLRS